MSEEMLCIVCNKKTVYIKDGNSLCKRHFTDGYLVSVGEKKG